MDDFITYIYFKIQFYFPKLQKYFKMSTENLKLHFGKNSGALWENASASHNNNVVTTLIFQL